MGFSCAPHPISCIVYISYFYNTFVQTKKLALVHYYYVNSRLGVGFTSFPQHVLFLFQDPIKGTTLTFSCRVSPMSSARFLNLS